MNPINRDGQKVICVSDHRAWLFVCPTITVYPRARETYTVSGFAPIKMKDGSEDIPGIHLRELEGFTCSCGGFTNEPWPVEAFRPVDERKTDISAFTQLLDKTPEKVRA
jgi:hypothetical protein